MENIEENVEIEESLVIDEKSWTSENDLHITVPGSGDWWVSFCRNFNCYFHKDCKDKWKELGIELVDHDFRKPTCKFCQKSMPEGVEMLIALQRQKAKIPGPNSV